MSDIELFQGDTDTVNFVLKETIEGVVTGANLSGATVNFIMKKKGSSTKITIACGQGATIKVSGEDVTVPFEEGGVHVDYTSTHTETAGEYEFYFVVTSTGMHTTFPSDSKGSMWIHPAL